MIALFAVSSYLFYGSLHSADMLSLRYAQSHPPPGYAVVEGHPLMRKWAIQIAVKAAATYGMGKLDSKIPKHKRWIPRVIIGVGYGVIAYRNMTLNKRRRGDP